MLGLFRREDPARRAASLLQQAIATRSRTAIFYTRFGVPDNVDGRFDLFTLHAFLVLERLKAPGGEAIGQHLANEIFASFENALREMGVSDAGLSRRIKAMANAFYGRVAAYDGAHSEQELLQALLRNLYRGQDRGLEARALAHYMQAMREHLRKQDLAAGEIDFGPLPVPGKRERKPMTSEKAPPFAVNFDLSHLPDGETEITLAPTAEQRAALAHWAGVDSLETLKGAVVLKKLGAGHFHCEARFTADVVQSCVVTLEPVRSHIAREFTRLYQIPEGVRHVPAKRAIQLTSHVEDDESEMLESSVLDIALPVLEELSLAIDPYPRKPGVAFQPPADALGKAENPFAVLKTLRTKR